MWNSLKIAIVIGGACVFGSTGVWSAGAGAQISGNRQWFEEGVSSELAALRKQLISELSYELVLSIPRDSTEDIQGQVTIQFDLSTEDAPVIVDFQQPADRVKSVSRSGTPLDFSLEDGHMIVPPGALRKGTNRLSVDFVAGSEPLNRREGYLYSLFVPDRASLAFPCFDQPDLKARFRLKLETPEQWKAVSNGALVDEEAEEDRRIFQFAETQPISTYLFAFAAGLWNKAESAAGGRSFNVYYRETDAGKLTRNLLTVVDLHIRALEWLEEYTGIPYPFEKFDFVLVPDFQFSGMEHPGAVFYRQSALLLEESHTQAELLNRARLIAHETAHMWFGDFVTMQWFDDVWMKEVFANFLAAKIVNPAYPDINHDLNFVLSHYPGAYSVDRTPGTHPIRQELENLKEAASLYGVIIYQKAPVVMRFLEQWIGEESLRDGLRQYLSEFSLQNADWNDLIRILDARTPEDLTQWSRVWVEEAGRPVFRLRSVLDEKGRLESATLEQEDPGSRNRFWPQRLKVLMLLENTRLQMSVVDVKSRKVELALPEKRDELKGILPNGDGFGYGLFELDPSSRAVFLGERPFLPDELGRAGLLLSLWEEMLEGWVESPTMLQFIRSQLLLESNQLIMEALLDRLKTLYWRFLPEETRQSAAPGLERLLWDLLDREAKESLKSALFRTYQAIAVSSEGLERMERLWRRDLRVEGLSLSEKDEATLSLELAVRQVAHWREILEEQLLRIENEERRRRFEFLMPSVSADPEVRRSFFESLALAENRRNEPWVLEGLQYLHHPLRKQESVQYILPGLTLLEEVERSGDIFFPKGWLDATLDGHNSAEAAAVVRDFLRTCEYSRRLKAKIEQSADGLFRASRIASR